MSRHLTATVYLTDEETGEVHVYGPESTVPKKHAKLISNPAVWSDGDTPDEPHAREYATWKQDALKAEIDTRNETRQDNAKLSKGGSNADMAARLETDDHLQAREYDALLVDDLTAEIGRRNEGRQDGATLSAAGNKADLVAALQGDDSAAV